MDKKNDNTLTVNNKEIFSRPLKLIESGPFQIAFIETYITLLYHTLYYRDLGHTITLHMIIQFCPYTWGNFFSFCFHYLNSILYIYTFTKVKEKWKNKVKRICMLNPPRSIHKYIDTCQIGFHQKQVTFCSVKFVGENTKI